MGWFRSKRTHQRIHNVVAAWRESAVKEIEIDNRLFAGFRDRFSEGYGSGGRKICEYADILAAAKIENSHSRRESELPSTREQIKLAILEVTELAVANQDNEVTFELLKIAYSSLARFLPESKAGIVTARNLGYLSEDPDHPSLRKSPEADRVEAEVGSEESRLGQEFDQIVAYDRHRKTRGIDSTPEAEALRETVLAYRESASRGIAIDNAELSECRLRFGEGYGPNGLLVCEYVDVIAKATIENSRSRSVSELPASPEKIKQAIRDVAELAIARQEVGSALEPLQTAYSFLARFLPESQASLVTKYNRGCFSEDPDHPDLPRSEEEEAQQIEAEVDAEQDRLGEEFDQIIAYDHHRENSSMTLAKERLEWSQAEFREAVSKMMEIDSDLLAACRNKFAEGYGPSGLLVRAADVIARATIENSRSRSESELPASPAKIKQALIEVAEVAMAQQHDDLDLKSLKLAYSFLARFLPESDANLVTARNLGQLSQDSDHPGLLRSDEAEGIDAKVAAEEDRLDQEFDVITLELLEQAAAKGRQKQNTLERELAEMVLDLNPDDDGVNVNNAEQEAVGEAMGIIKAFGKFLSESQPIISDAQLLPYPKGRIAQSLLMYERYLCDVANEYDDSQDVEKLKEIDQTLGPIRACRGLVATYSIIEPRDMKAVSYFNSFKSIGDVPKDESEQCFDLKTKYASKGMEEELVDEKQSGS